MATKSSVVFVVKVLGVVMLLLVQIVCGVEFQVGGSKGVWAVPSHSNALNQWAESHRFQIGDSLVFKYEAGQDSVLLVNQDDYNNCNTESPIKHFSDGHTIVKFEKSGPHYFISGNKDNCLKNQKIVVIILAVRTKQYSSPPPAPAEEPESPPPEATVQMNPTPSPIAEEPPANAASSIISFLGLTGVFATTSALLL